MGAMEVHDFDARGKGWRATQNLEAGELLLAEKSVTMVLDSAIDDDGSDAVNVDTALLIIAVAKAIAKKPEIWAAMSELYPRKKDVGELRDWSCKSDDPALHSRVQEEVSKLSQLSAEEKKQLMLIVRYNNLGCETNAEQLCYLHKYQQWGGVGLYVDASYFNHSCTPNVNRYNVGDIMYFRTNSAVKEGEELCITYIESEMLSEPLSVRNHLLGDRDFKLEGEEVEKNEDEDEKNGGAKTRKKEAWAEAEAESVLKRLKLSAEEEEEGGESDDGEDGMPRICGNFEMMQELMACPPLERLTAVDELYEVCFENVHPTQ
jgi:SET and MYND domain-containing protein